MTSTPFDALLARRGVVLFDGALATELERKGADLSSHLWSARLIADAPDTILAVHLDALRAGADVVSSASYQASRLGFAKLGLSAHEADARLTRAVTLAKEAVAQHGSGLVAASLGPYGAVLADGSEYTGDYPLSVSELVAFHRPRVEAALAGAPDVVLFETLPSMAECEAVAELAGQFPDVPFLASFSTSEAGLAHGEPFADAVARLERVPNVIAAGLNCGSAQRLATLLRGVTPGRVLLSAMPNSAETWDAVARRWSGRRDEGTDFGAQAIALYRAGARVIGGCCRTTPLDLASARAALAQTVSVAP